MIIALIVLILSFLLDGIISNFLFISSTNFMLFGTIYILVSLVILCPYFYNAKKFFIFTSIFGLLFDIVYTNTFVLNLVVFILLGIVIRFFHSFLANSLFSNIFISLITIMLYYLFTFFFLFISNYNGGLLFSLGKILYSNIFMTIIYSVFLYYAVKFMLKKLKMKQFK